MAQLFSRQAGILRSGDSLVDCFFRQCLEILRSERVVVVRKKRLMDPDQPRAIRGLMDPEIHPSGKWVQITISASKNTHQCRDEEVETLVHELAHVMLPKASERHILTIENILAKRLTRQQRTVLKAFLPRHEVKKYPVAIA